MPDRRLKETLADGTLITVGKGKDDDWCLYENGVPIKDDAIFSKLKDLHDKHSIPIEIDFMALEDKICADLNEGNNGINENMYRVYIPNCAAFYFEDSLLFEKAFIILYLTMLAEENKILKGGIPSRTGFKIKSVAAYHIMREKIPVKTAVKWVDNNKFLLESTGKVCF